MRQQIIPDSIAGLVKLEELYLSSNHLARLPDSIGLLINLKVLDVSANKLNALPESIAGCRYCSIYLVLSYFSIFPLPI